MQKTTKKELAEEVERLRAFVKRINELSSKVIGTEEDVSDEVVVHLEQELSRLKELVFVDELTGVYNRRGFFEHTKSFFTEAMYGHDHPENKRSVNIKDYAVIFLDADNFKSINDSYGHDAGDSVLVQIAETLVKNVRHGDVVGRLGGEEFVVGFVGASEEEAAKKAERIRERIAESVKVPGGADRTVTASFGVASLAASDADELDELVAYADQAMYEAKTNRGKNTVVRFSELPK